MFVIPRSRSCRIMTLNLPETNNRTIGRYLVIIYVTEESKEDGNNIREILILNNKEGERPVGRPTKIWVSQL